MRRILSLILTLCIVATILVALPTVASADETYTEGTLTYTVTNGEATIIDCMATTGDFKINKYIGGFPVTAIGDYAFTACVGLTSITIPEGVVKIGSYAFNGCSGLRKITIPNTVTSIGSYAFNGCNDITSITIPDSVTSIGYRAFNGCSDLRSLTLSNNLRYIGSGILDDTELYNNNDNWESNVLYVGNYLIGAKTYISGKYSIKKGTVCIADYAFSGCTALSNVVIPDSVTSIGSGAFNGCSSLTNATIPDSVTSIGDSAFNGCSSLTGITIPDSVNSIDSSVFYNCKSLTNVTIPDSVTSIGDRAFYNCESLTSITIPDSVNSIGSYAFYNTPYYNDENNWVDDVLYIDNWLLEAKTTLSGAYEIKNGTIMICGNAFMDCSSLTSVAIPDSVNSIGYSAFYDCSSLTSITIPNSVTSIGNYAFVGCSSLTDVYYGGTKKDWAKISIGSYNEPLTNATIHFTEPKIPEEVTGEFDGGDEEFVIGEGENITISEGGCIKNAIIEALLGFIKWGDSELGGRIWFTENGKVSVKKDDTAWIKGPKDDKGNRPYTFLQKSGIISGESAYTMILKAYDKTTGTTKTKAHTINFDPIYDGDILFGIEIKDVPENIELSAEYK